MLPHSANQSFPMLPRRTVLKSVASGFGYLAFAGLAARAAEKERGKSPLEDKRPHFEAKAKRVILLCMSGGPSHVDLFDYKPTLNKKSGEPAKFGKIGGGARWMGAAHPFAQHGESGLWITKLFPHLAKHADDLCIINSMHTDLPNHPQAFAQLHTGSFQFVRPSLGAWTLYGLGTQNENLPGFVTLNPPSDFGGARNYGSAFLPAIYQGTKLGGAKIPELFAALTKKDQEPGPPLKNLENPNLSTEQQRAQLDLVKSLNEDRKSVV